MEMQKKFDSRSIGYGGMSSRRADAGEQAYFANELTAYDPKIYEIFKSPLTSFKVFPQKSIEEHNGTYVYGTSEGFGKAAYTAARTGKSKDTRMVGVGGNQYALILQELTCFASFSHSDILAGQAVRRNIIDTLLRQCQRANMELMNETCFLGNKEHGLYGVLNNPNTVKQTVVVAGDTVDLATGSGEKLLNTLCNLVKNLADESSALIEPDTLLVSPLIYTNIKNSFFGTQSGLKVLSLFEDSTGVKVIKAPELSKKYYSNTREMAVLFNNNSDYLENIVADYFTPFTPQPDGLEFNSYCRSSHGGVVIRQPKTVSIITNAS